MIFKSGWNLKSSIIDFIENAEELILLCAYVKTNQIVELNNDNKFQSIVVRWEIEDLLKGASDLSLYNYCKQNNIALFRNTRLHMKVLWDNNGKLISGSANFTNKGIGEIGNYNYELNTLVESIEFEDALYLQKVIRDSEYVDDQLYLEIEKSINDSEIETNNIIELPTVKKESDFFLISELPQADSPAILFDMLSQKNLLSEIEKQILIHDMILYDIVRQQNKSDFLSHLEYQFNNHPFIVEFKDAVKHNHANRPERAGSMNFGAVRLWFAENTTTVPTPRPFELSEYIQVLYTWICYFDDEFSWSVPGGHSQVIQYRAI
jgi:hypothetical protein